MVTVTNHEHMCIKIKCCKLFQMRLYQVVSNVIVLYMNFTEIKKPKLPEILDATNEIKDWYQLGLQLGIPALVLEKIQNKYSDDLMGAKNSMFKKWLVVKKSSWDKLITALNVLGYVMLANDIAQTHGIGKSIFFKYIAVLTANM